MSVPAAAWREWAGSALFEDGLRARAAIAGIRRRVVDGLLQKASEDAEWRPLAALDASLRMIAALRRSGGITARDAERTLGTIWSRARATSDPAAVVPAEYWSVQPAPPAGGGEQVQVRGAVLVRVSGARAAEERERRLSALPRDLEAALREPPAQPGRHLFAMLRADGALAPAALAIALTLAAAGVVLEALLFRSLIELGSHLSLSGQRLATMAALVCLAGLLLALEVPIATLALGLGRRLETRLRAAFLRKIPRLTDRYVQSRPSSDMAERAHAAHQVRELPNMAAHLARSGFELVLTTLGIALLYPESGGIAAAAAVTAVAVPVAAQPWLRERDLRQRTHTGALTRFYLDAFLGLVPVRAHGAERALAREQEALLVEWARAARATLRAAVATSGAQVAAGFGFAAWLLFSRAQLGDEGGGALLLAYWALNIPVLGQEIALVAWQYPTQRNLTLRLLEPLGAHEEDEPPPAAEAAPSGAGRSGVALDLRDVVVRAGGHTILQNATISVAPGTHVAIVGASGAGKSTLVGLLLGWHRAAEGEVRVDGAPLDGAVLDALRRQIAWVDPAVQLWNRSLLENLEFGRDPAGAAPLGVRLETADLRRVIEQLPEGLQTRIGEGGTLVSGGEGQRVRFGRALARGAARLVILDEPFRGLERETRAALLQGARQRWRDATLLCVTHDIADTASFDRVLVIDRGRIVEDGTPAALADSSSRYRSLLDAESTARLRLWRNPGWRLLRLHGGRITAAGTPAPAGSKRLTV
jgi:ATP-binding cassette subfamily B protein